MIAPTDVVAKPDIAVSVQKLVPGTLVTMVRTERGWMLVAKDGKQLGYVAGNALAPVQ